MATQSQVIRRRDLVERVRRWVRYRLIVPLKRSRHAPDYVARSVGVGMFWALTPTVGIQMALVMLHWIVVRRLGRWDFNVIHAMAWTWVTNVFTLLPFYYLFYVSGQVLLGRWQDLTGYHGFVHLWEGTTATAESAGAAGGLVGWLHTLWSYLEVIVGGWGLAMCVGSLPWAILGAWFGYRWSLGLVVHHRRARLERRLRRQEASADPAERDDGARPAA